MRVGVLGGTFDPIHQGHLAAAQDVLETLDLDRILFIPAARPPHKDGDELTPSSLRLRMVRAAVEADPRFEVSDLEVRREGPSYTVETLRALREVRQEDELFLLLGADQWRGFGSWREPREIVKMAQLVVMTREGEHPREVDPGFDDGMPAPPFHEIRVTRMDLSSTEIRARVSAGRSIRYLVPEEALRIIEASKMYL